MEERKDIFSPDENEERVLSIEELAPDVDELTLLLDEKKYGDFIRRIQSVPPVDIADLFCEIDKQYRPIFYRLLPKELAADVFVEMDSDAQEEMISSFTDSELASMLDELYLDDTVDIIEEMPAVVVKRIIKNSTHENRALINQLLRYPKDSAGTIMTTEYVRFRGSMTEIVFSGNEKLRTVWITGTGRGGVGKVVFDIRFCMPLCGYGYIHLPEVVFNVQYTVSLIIIRVFEYYVV